MSIWPCQIRVLICVYCRIDEPWHTKETYVLFKTNVMNVLKYMHLGQMNNHKHSWWKRSYFEQVWRMSSKVCFWEKMRNQKYCMSIQSSFLKFLNLCEECPQMYAFVTNWRNTCYFLINDECMICPYFWVCFFCNKGSCFCFQRSIFIIGSTVLIQPSPEPWVDCKETRQGEPREQWHPLPNIM